VALIPRDSRRERIFVRLVGGLLYLAFRFLGLTTRKRYDDRYGLRARMAAGEPIILAFWHGRMAMMPFAYSGRGACIMNSAHRDGSLVSEAVRRFGIEVVEGSSTRGWVRGLRGLLAAHARGRDLVVVPDGPRGPRCRAKSGVLQLARATGAPIYLVSYGASHGWTIRRSWDWLLVPAPGARVHYAVEPPLEVPREASVEEIEALRLELEQRLNRATRRADAAAGVAARATEEYIGAA